MTHVTIEETIETAIADLEAQVEKLTTVLDRFWAKVKETPDGHLLWTAGTDSAGYPKLKVGRDIVAAHRFIWELENGPIPEGCRLTNLCGDPLCVRPGCWEARPHFRTLGIEEFFQASIEPDEGTGCHVWTGPCDAAGYGRLYTDGAHVPAHRWAYAQKYGPIPAGHHVHHTCGNPCCVNPEHLIALARDMHAATHGAIRDVKAAIGDGRLEAELARLLQSDPAEEWAGWPAGEADIGAMVGAT